MTPRLTGRCSTRREPAAAPTGYVVLTALDRRFLRMFDLWFRYYRLTGIPWPVHVAAIGGEACAAMQARATQGDHLVVHPLAAHRCVVHVRRLHVLKALLDRGLDVVFTDLDAFWLSEHASALADRRFDLQASISNGWPPATRSKWGFSLCAGYMIIHSNASTKRLMHQWILKAYQSDDQVALNHILVEHGTRWKHAGRVGGNQGACRALGLTVEAIDYRCVTRTKDTRRLDRCRLVVFHPRLTARTTSLKVLQSVAGLSRLRPRPFLCPVAIRASLRVARRWIWWMLSILFGRRFADRHIRGKRG